MLRVSEDLRIDSQLGETVALANFSAPEAEFVWTDGRWAEITFDLDPRDVLEADTPFQIEIDLDVFRFPPSLNGQNVLIYCNGVRVKSAYVSERTTLRFSLGVAPLMQRQNVLTLDLPDARMPQDFGLPDERLLGAQIYSFAINPAA